jgi:hypothetical protein
VHHTNIGLEKIKVHIRKLVPYNQKSLTNEKTKDPVGSTQEALLDHFHDLFNQGWCALGRSNSFSSSSLAALLNFVIATNTSMGVKTVSFDRALGSTTPNWWQLFHPNPKTAPFIVTMTLWYKPEAIDCIL